MSDMAIVLLSAVVGAIVGGFTALIMLVYFGDR